VIINPYAFGAPAGGSWSPADIATALWFDADDAGSFTLDGADVDQWNDKSGNDRHATPATATKPTRTASGINSKGSVVFGSGADPLLTSTFANPASADGFTLAMVLRRAGQPVNFSNPVTKGAVNAEWSLIWANTAQGNISYLRSNLTGGNTVATASSTLVDATDYLWTCRMSDADMAQYRWGTVVASTGTPGSNRPPAGTSALTIGSSPDGSYANNRFQGQIAEIVVVHADVTSATRELLEGYLAWKWGLQGSLPGAHPYKSAPP
jgi:hypothetical protein